MKILKQFFKNLAKSKKNEVNCYSSPQIDILYSALYVQRDWTNCQENYVSYLYLLIFLAILRNISILSSDGRRFSVEGLGASKPD